MPAVEANSTKRKQARIGADVEQTLHGMRIEPTNDTVQRDAHIKKMEPRRALSAQRFYFDFFSASFARSAVTQQRS